MRTFYLTLTIVSLAFAGWIGYWAYVWFVDPVPLSLAELLAGLSAIISLTIAVFAAEKFVEVHRAHRRILLGESERRTSWAWNDADASSVD